MIFLALLASFATIDVQLPPVDKAHIDKPSQGAGAVYRLPFAHREAPNRTGYYYISHKHPAEGRRILVLMHGYKGDGEYVAQWMKDLAEQHGVALMAPDSAGDYWEVANEGKYTADMVHIMDAVAWLRRHTTSDPKHMGIMGHSYGTRMAAYVGTNIDAFQSVLLSHGRFIPASLGSNHAQAWFSGSPRDPWFNFSVMKGQWESWPGPHSLHTFDCPTCFHPPSPQELSGMMDWFISR